MKKFGILALATLVVACNGGGGGSSSGGGGGSGKTISGRLLDSAIEGVKYSSASMSGITNAQGSYTCKEGETVSFYLPASNVDIPVGSASCRKVTSPVELVLGTSYSIDTDLSTLSSGHRQAVHNILRLVQSLDSDGNPSNGITILSSDVDLLVTDLAGRGQDVEEDGLEVYTTLNEADMSTMLNNLVSDLGGLPYVAVSEASAVSHFQSTKDSLQNSGGEQGGGDEGGNNGGDNGGGASKTIAMCLSGKMWDDRHDNNGSLVALGSHPVNPIDGQVGGGGLGNSGVQLYNTLFVLYTDGTAGMFRANTAETEDAPYAYHFSNSGWTNTALNPTTSVLSINEVGFNFNGVGVDLIFDSHTQHGDERDNIRYVTERAFGKNVEPFTVSSTCEVPTGTTEVVVGGTPSWWE